MIKLPVVIDCTDRTIAQFRGQVIRDATGLIICECLLSKTLLSNGQFSYAQEIQAALNRKPEL